MILKKCLSIYLSLFLSLTPYLHAHNDGSVVIDVEDVSDTRSNSKTQSVYTPKQDESVLDSNDNVFSDSPARQSENHDDRYNDSDPVDQSHIGKSQSERSSSLNSTLDEKDDQEKRYRIGKSFFVSKTFVNDFANFMQYFMALLAALFTFIATSILDPDDEKTVNLIGGASIFCSAMSSIFTNINASNLEREKDLSEREQEKEEAKLEAREKELRHNLDLQEARNRDKITDLLIKGSEIERLNQELIRQYENENRIQRDKKYAQKELAQEARTKQLAMIQHMNVIKHELNKETPDLKFILKHNKAFFKKFCTEAHTDALRRTVVQVSHRPDNNPNSVSASSLLSPKISTFSQSFNDNSGRHKRVFSDSESMNMSTFSNAPPSTNKPSFVPKPSILPAVIEVKQDTFNNIPQDPSLFPITDHNFSSSSASSSPIDSNHAQRPLDLQDTKDKDPEKNE